jgi:transglutaminase-like putative cysteine protease
MVLRSSPNSTFARKSECKLIDHNELDWENVAGATYRIQQRFRYEYPGPIFDLSHRLVALPRLVHADQRRLSLSITVLPDALPRSEDDHFGNEVVTFCMDRIDGSFEIGIEATVRRMRMPREHPVSLETLLHPGYREKSPLTKPDRALAEAAASLRERYRNDRELAEAIVAFVHRELTYTKGVTDVATSAAAAFQTKRGVCQDFAHVALAIARACGLAARYVSGHLLGEGATHAWIEFLFPVRHGGAMTVSYDPTYGTSTSLHYVVVAVGRDYRDVAPTSGVYRAPYAGTLQARTNVHVREVSYR